MTRDARRMILVLGMHRSGTSAVAGTLAQLGVEFSEHLIEPAEDNPKGFFEHADVWPIDHRLLHELGLIWDDVLTLPEDWQQTPAVEEAQRAAHAVLRRDFAGAALAGIKDPRMCRLVPVWRRWIEQEGFAPCAVLAIRRPDEVIASLVKRDHLPVEQAAGIWLRYVIESEAATRGMPRVVVHYDRLLEDWRRQVERIEQALDLSWPQPVATVGAQIDAFLEPALRHNRGNAQTGLVGSLRDWLDRVYAALRAESVDVAVLDAVSREMAQADHVAQASTVTLRALRGRSLRIEGELRWLEQEHAGLAEGHAHVLENLQRHQQELAGMAEGNAWLREELDRHAQANAALQESIASLHQEMAVRDRQLEVETAERARLAGELGNVYASRSWRITRPVRFATRLARRMLGRTPDAVAATTAVPVVVPPIADAQGALDSAFAAATGPRVLIVTPDIQGPIRNGGIGTAFAALARTLAAAGHAVTILYTLGGHSEDGLDIGHWVAQYAAQGIRFIPVWLERGEPTLDAPHHAWRAYRVYLWLKAQQQDYDLAYFPEWKGESYYALQAKRLGLDFARLRIVVVTHSSTTWAESGNYVVPQKFDDLLLEFLERRSTEMADAVISPSHYMLDWMRARGWRWAAPTHVVQNLMPDALEPVPGALAPGAFQIVEWVFFGRLERRKGLFVFLDALERLPVELRQRIRVTFLGKAVLTPEFDSCALIAQRMAGWPQAVRVLANYDRDQALAYLQGPGRVAVIASLVENSPYTVLECVLKRIPFIAADVGGIAELIADEDRGRALFQPTPTGLAQRLLALDGAHYVPPRPAVPAEVTRDRWLDLQQTLLEEIPAAPTLPAAPALHITVCLVHYDRPAMLAQAIDSLRRQTYAHFDVVLVDDGSPSAEAKQYLDSLQDEFAWRGWSIVRQANAYLGAARNAAARHARGEYLLFMDDDNLAKPHELAVFAQAASQSGADILTTVSDVFESDAGASPPTASRQLWVPLGNAAGLGVFRNVFGDANALVRKATFEALGGFTEDYGVGHEDWEFFARAVLAGVDLQLVPEPLFWYRVNATSMLRAGRSQIDHARSTRPYWEGLPGGVGPALAYASYMHRHPPQPPAVETMPAGLPGRRRRWVTAATAIFRPQLRAHMKELVSTHGWRATVVRALRYIAPPR